MTTTYGEPRRPNAGIGDLVTIDGYGNRVFRVDSINYEYYLDEEVEHDGIFYETTDVRTFEMLLADDVDITVVSPSENARDRKSTRLNSSHVAISYAVFCLKKKKTRRPIQTPGKTPTSTVPRRSAQT